MILEGVNFKTVRNLLKNIDIVESSVEMHGKRIPFASLTLEQKFNAHHVMKLRVNYEALFTNGFMATPEDVIKLIGEKISLTMKHRITGSYNLFFGLVTDAVIEGTKGTDNNILITAKSTSIRLDGKKSMDSFFDTYLATVVNEAVHNSNNIADMIIEPSFDGIIDYLCQYNETDFEFFNRLSYIYGEWFWYDGTMTHFGRGDISAEKPVELTYDVEMLDFRLRAKLTPARFNRYNYLIHDDDEISAIAPKDVPGLRGYLQCAVDQSDLAFQAEGDLPCDAPVLSYDELKRLVRIERSRAVGQMLTVEGTSRTSEVKIGKIVKIKMPYDELPLKEVEQFLVTGVTHTIDELGHYSNTFTGIISDIEAIPMELVAPPHAYPQQATVMDNADPKNKGRVQVQLQWQKSRRKNTNWIRVATPDAGSSGKVSTNRGLVTIPEVGDQVMVGFEYGDPNRPYVMSSIFTEKAGAGGGASNKTKSLTSRSGNQLKLDDSNGSVLINDQTGGNKMFFNGKETINISANDHIVITNGKCTIEMQGEKIKVSAPKEIAFESENIMLSGKENISVQSPAIKIGDSEGELANNTLDLKGKKITEEAGESYSANSPQITVEGTEKAEVKAGKLTLSGNAKIDMISPEINSN